MKTRLLRIAIAVLTFLAYTNAAAACWNGNYQPELPAQLRDY